MIALASLHPYTAAFYLATGWKLGKEGKEALKRNKILGFFVQDEVEINGFFQHAKSDSELIDGILHIKGLARNNAQWLAYKTWLGHGIDEIIKHKTKESIIEKFLTVVSGQDLGTVADVLSGYLTNEDVTKLLFTSGLHLEKRFEQLQPMIDELYMSLSDDSSSLLGFLGDDYFEKRNKREAVIKQKAEKGLSCIRYLYKETMESEAKKECPNKAVYTTVSTAIGAIVGLTIAYAVAAALSTIFAIMVFVAAASVGALVGYGIGKFCEKVAEKKQNCHNISTFTAIKSVLFDISTEHHATQIQV